MVIHFPIFCPIIIGIAICQVTTPVAESACKIQTEAEELWIIAVNTKPVKIPMIGFSNEVNNDLKLSKAVNGAKASSIVVIPQKRIQSQTKILATSFNFFLFPKRRIAAPIARRIYARTEGLRILNKRFSVPRSPSLKICAVTVLPTLDPKTTGIACDNFIIPAFTNPISIIVVAAELWIIAVTPSPNPRPFNIPASLFFPLVSFSRSFSSPDHASFSSEDPIRLIP